jgi:uncharacterized delta-60 repeat protein
MHKRSKTAIFGWVLGLIVLSLLQAGVTPLPQEAGGGCTPAATFRKARGCDDDVFAIEPAGDGTEGLYLGGGFTTYNGTPSNGIVRLNSDGSVDPGFVVGSGFDGLVSVIAGVEGGARTLYVGGGFKTYNGTPSSRIIRLKSDGSLDPAFVVGSGFDVDVSAISPVGGGTGDLYVGGAFKSYNGTRRNGIIRLNSDGSVDPAFAVGSGFSGMVSVIAKVEDGTGDIYVGGFFKTYNGTPSSRIIRLKSDGSLDPAFVVGSGFDVDVSAISPVGGGTGDLYVGGAFKSYNGTRRNGIIRLNSDGSVDPAFAVGSGFDPSLVETFSISSVFTIVPIEGGTGELYVGGPFTTYNGRGINRIVRLKSDGSVDPAFAVGSGFDACVNALAPVGGGTGDLYVGGDFTTYGTTVVDNIACLGASGLLQ